MNTLKMIVLAIIQGITEPLPISSSGHLVIFEELMHLELPGFEFELFMNFGSLLGILFFFRKDLFCNLSSLHKKETRQYIYKVPFAALPAGIIGFFFMEYFEQFKSSAFVAIFLIVTGLLLLSAKYFKAHKHELTYKDSIFIGISQIISLIPGISRSGMTTVAGLSRGLTKEEALKFSFIIYIPLSFLSGMYSLMKLENFDILYVLYLGIAAVMTYIGLIFFKKVLLSDKLHYFAGYCFILALIILI